MHPELLPWSAIEPFGLFLAVGLAMGVALSRKLAARAALDPAEGMPALVLALILALPSARLVYGLGSGEPRAFAAWFSLVHGGLSGYGALAGATLGAAVALRNAAGRRLAWFDVAAPGVLLTALVARLGCYLAGCDFGRPLGTNAPRWLARLGTFPATTNATSPSPAWLEHVTHAGGSRDPFTAALHPTQLYEVVGLACALAVTLVLRRHQRRHGVVAAGAVVTYAALRFTTEGFRGDADRGVFALVTLTQIWALASLAAIAVAVSIQLARARRSS